VGGCDIHRDLGAGVAHSHDKHTSFSQLSNVAVSAGVFSAPEQAQAYALLHGTVLDAERRTVIATGQSFIAARVRTAGFEVDLCVPATIPVPEPGNIIGGQVFLVASMPALHAQ